MSISTTADKMVVQSLFTPAPIFHALSLLRPGIVIGWTAVGAGSPKCKAKLLGVTMLLLLTLSLLTCGGVSSAASTTPLHKPVVYQITVTGTSAGTSPDAGQSAVVTLVVD